jgi:signal transduction histidine kinase
MPAHPPGLRTQLLLGLAVVFLVATLSAGGIGYWAVRSRQLDDRVAQARVLAEAAARMVSAAMVSGDRAALPRLLSELGAGTLIGKPCVVGPSGELIAGPTLAGEAAQHLRRAALAGLQQIRVVEQPAPVLVVDTPVIAEGGTRGALHFEMLLGLGEGWPPLFWVLIGFDTVLIVIFVALVLTRYVVGPLQAMQRAAARVAEGDLGVRLDSGGAMELDSLAGSFNRMTVSVQDQLTRLAHQQHELEASREHLIRSEKLASVGRLAAGVAHEVGNPLQSIIGFVEMILAGGIPEQQTRDFLERTRGEAQRIHRIIRDLLDFARPVEDAIEPVSLESLVEQSLQLVGPQQRLRAVTVEREGLSGLRQVAASSSRVVQVLVNILLNAADAMKGHGTIFIAARNDDGAGRVELRIANSGPPIPPEHRGRIFDPFFTTKEPGHGTGLGLSVAQSIVESYGGRLVLLDEPRTTFALLLQPWREPEKKEAR